VFSKGLSLVTVPEGPTVVLVGVIPRSILVSTTVYNLVLRDAGRLLCGGGQVFWAVYGIIARSLSTVHISGRCAPFIENIILVVFLTGYMLDTPIVTLIILPT